MKVYIRLGLHTEYHGYSIYWGIFKSLTEAIEDTAKDLGHVKCLGYITHTHVDEEYDDFPNTPHTHVVFFNKDFGVPSKSEFIEALEHYDEEEFSEHDYAILRTIVILEEEV